MVPHPTLGRWLVLALAKELGIAANVSIELPAQYAWSIMHDALGTLSRDTPFAPDRLRWRIYDQVASLAGPGTEPVRNYLADNDPRKRFELADRLARVYDRCLLYRPDWIREWERGETPHWQATLWRRLTEGTTEPSHWVAAIDAFREAGDSFDKVESWPRRTSFFGVAALSPSYLDLLRKAGEHLDIHLYLLSPCREYWSDIAPRRVIQRRADPSDPAAEYRTEGNELLGAWGKLGRDMQALLLDSELSTGTPAEHYDDPQPNIALGTVQRDILELRMASEAKARDPVAPDDSIQIHVCHSAMREAEVLHDRLLGLFDAHPDIQPAHVLVLTPNIVDYAPAVEAVFAAAGVIPFNIARPRATATRAVQAFLDLLTLPDSRYGAEAVLAPLESAAVRERFRIAERDLSTLREWVDAAGIRWGIDADHREREGLPRFDGHAWRQGIDRLLLGFAMDGDDVMFERVAPCSTDSVGISGDPELLGRFVDYCEAAIQLRGLTERTLPVADWGETLHGLVGRFFATDWHNTAEAGAVTRLIEGFAAESDVAARIPLAVVRDVLLRAAGGLSRPAARLAEGITVTSLGIGQAFPAEVVCALGMNDRLFPRRASPSTFDLVDADDEHIGDRNSRDEDRFAFLEALLAARRCLLVSYTGRNVRDDKPMPPSVVVDELRDYLERRFGGGFDFTHPLQPFSRRYFEPGSALDALRAPDVDGQVAYPTMVGERVSVLDRVAPATRLEPSAGEREGRARMWSYARPMRDAALTLAGHAEQGMDARGRERYLVPFVPTDGDADASVDLGRLIAFFGNPSRAFLRDRLGIRLEVDEIALRETEPFKLDGLEQWSLKSEMFGLDSVDPVKQLMAARGRLPAGGPGDVVYEDMGADVLEFQRALKRHEAALKAPPEEVEMEVGGVRLTGAVSNVAAADGAPAELLRWRIGSMRPQDRIGAWLELLAWVAQKDGAARADLVCLAKGGVEKTRFEAPDPAAARSHLGRWLDAWREGLTALLPFSPAASMKYAENLEKARSDGKTPDEASDLAWDAACVLWHNERSYDSLKNDYVSLAYDGEDPFNRNRFAGLAETLLLPLLAADVGAGP